MKSKKMGVGQVSAYQCRGDGELPGGRKRGSRCGSFSASRFIERYKTGIFSVPLVLRYDLRGKGDFL